MIWTYSTILRVAGGLSASRQLHPSGSIVNQFLFPDPSEDTLVTSLICKKLELAPSVMPVTVVCDLQYSKQDPKGLFVTSEGGAPMKAAAARTRISLKNILYATDFSPMAEAAAPYAAELALRYGSKVFAVHVRAPQVTGLVPPESWQVVREATERQATEQAEHLKSLFRGVENEVTVIEGGVWNELETIIEEKNIDLIVIGTRGRKGLGKFLLGSVAETILRRTHCPVLTVGPHVTLEAGRAVGMNRIIYATSLSPNSQTSAAYAISLADENQAHLDLLHVIETQKVEELVHPSELMNACLNRLRQIVTPEAALWCEPEFLIERGDPAEQILSVAKRRGADMIVLGVKGAEGDLGASTHFPWAVAHKVIAGATCPVLTVRG
jgi:nucleotide-binding universal stress UspA family protein